MRVKALGLQCAAYVGSFLFNVVKIFCLRFEVKVGVNDMLNSIDRNVFSWFSLHHQHTYVDDTD